MSNFDWDYLLQAPLDFEHCLAPKADLYTTLGK